MEWGCLCWPFGEWTVAFAATLAPFGHCGEDWMQTGQDNSLVALRSRGLYLCQSP